MVCENVQIVWMSWQLMFLYCCRLMCWLVRFAMCRPSIDNNYPGKVANRRLTDQHRRLRRFYSQTHLYIYKQNERYKFCSVAGCSVCFIFCLPLPFPFPLSGFSVFHFYQIYFDSFRFRHLVQLILLALNSTLSKVLRDILSTTSTCQSVRQKPTFLTVSEKHCIEQ